MIKNYLKIAWRNLVNNKAHSVINIVGLSVGMAVAMLIGLWIWDELSFNKYHQNYDRIGQVMQKQKFLGGIKVWENMPYLLANELKTNYKNDFKHIVTATSADHYLLSAGETKISQIGQFIESSAPDMLTLKMLKGSRSALNDPRSIILSASSARELFGNSDPMDKTIRISDAWDASQHKDVKVTGVYEDLPYNTQFTETRFFLPWDLYANNNEGLKRMEWDNHRFLMYAEISPNTDFDKVNVDIKNSELKIISHLDNMKQEAATDPQILLNPMKNWHLYADFKDGIVNSGPIQFVWIVGIIGAFVLLLACINFMNLSTARSVKRAKEVGVRKAIGSGRRQLIIQFFGESFLIVIVAYVIALVFAVIALPLLNNLAAKQITMPFTNLWFWLFSVLFIVFTGVVAGIYPALYLSSFRPAKVLKGSFQAGRFAAVPRKVLVVMQFTVSIILIICTIIIYKQLVFGKNRPVGYSRNGLIMVPMTSLDFSEKYAVIRNELKSTGMVTEVAQSESPVTGVSSHNGGFTWKGKDPGIEDDFGTLTVTHEYGKTIGWQFVDGRDFSKDFSTDSSGFVINEAAAKYMGLKHPIGEIVHWESKWLSINKDFKVIGVIKDMVMKSPFDPVQPTIFRIGGNPNWIYIRINPKVNAGNALSKITAVFKKIIPAASFEYKFADDEYAKKFSAEEHISKLISFFASLAIFISCLGLFGMASYMAEQRTKEIGVRKVMGATVLNVWTMLSKDFVVLVIISITVASPVAYYFMHNWLQGYQYRSNMSFWVFVLTGLSAICITLLTVSYQSIKAALMNPVKSLRSE